MGLHPREHAAHKHSVVLHPQLIGHSSLPLWDGRHDTPENFAQGHCKVVSQGGIGS